MPIFANLDHRRLGRTLIIVGVCVWIPYFALKLSGGHPELLHFLPFHLAGVIPGAIISRWPQIQRLLGRTASAGPQP